MLSSEEIEFLVALNAREESFLYEVYADLWPRLIGKTKQEVIDAAMRALNALGKEHMVLIGRRDLSYNELGSMCTYPFPPDLHEPHNWLWPSESDSREKAFWFVSTTEKRMPGRGLESVSLERGQELMFDNPTRPNNSFKSTPKNGAT